MTISGTGTGLLAAALLAALAMTSSTASAQPAVGLHGGFDFIIDEPLIGLHGRIPFAQIGPNAQAVAYPNVDFFVFGDTTIFGFDADLIFPFRVETFPISPYAGIGLGITYETGEFTEETDFDMNLLTGTSILTGTLFEPFVEVEASLFGTDRVALIIGFNIMPWYGASDEGADGADAGLDE